MVTGKGPRKRRKHYGGRVWGEVSPGSHVQRAGCREHAYGRWMRSGSRDRYYRMCRTCQHRQYIPRARYIELLQEIVTRQGGNPVSTAARPAPRRERPAVAPRGGTRLPWERDDAGERAGAPREASWNAPQRRGSAGGWYQEMESRRRG